MAAVLPVGLGALPPTRWAGVRLRAHVRAARVHVRYAVQAADSGKKSRAGKVETQAAIDALNQETKKR